MHEERAIIALDEFTTQEELIRVAQELSGRVWGFKVHDAIDKFGPGIIAILKQYGKVFVDMKLFDIPNTVAARVDAYMAHNADLITVHAAGGEAVMRAAVVAGGDKIAAVTQLTSDPDSSQVLPRAILAHACGVRNIVCSPREARLVKESLPDVRVITPGIRGRDDPPDDQRRHATPEEAVTNGADLLVVGRPIAHASDPVGALKKLFRF